MQESSPQTPSLEPVRPVRPVAGYVGGKRNLAKRLCALIDGVEHRIYAEPFVGMGGVFLRRERKPASEVINDLSSDVAVLFRILQRHYVAFMEMLRYQLTTREGFERLLRVDPETLTDLERAARFLYLQRLSFGGKVASRSFGVDARSPAGFDLTKLAPMLEAVHERLAGVVIERLPFDRFIAAYDRPETLFYVDPPYYGSEQSYGRDLFGRPDFDQLAAALSAVDGAFILSLNDCPEVRHLFRGFAMQPVSTTYSVGGGKNAARFTELVITNRPAVLDRLPGEDRA